MVPISEISLTNASAALTQLDQMLTGGRTVRIDTAGWSSCDLAGLAILLSGFRTAKLRDARLEVVAPEGSAVGVILARTGLGEDHLIRDQDGIWTDITSC